MARPEQTPQDDLNKKIISRNILRYLKERNLKPIDIHRQTGIPKGTLSGYINATSLPNPGNVQKIADYFNVWKSDIDPRFKSTKELTDIAYPDTKRIPIIGEIACGHPITAEQNIDGYRSEPADRLPSGDVFFLRCKGNSMEPTISDGSYVLIKGQPEVEDGEIAAVLVDDQTEATLKRVHHQGGNIVLTGDNASFPPIILNEQYPGRIIGKAIRVSFDL